MFEQLNDDHQFDISIFERAWRGKLILDLTLVTSCHFMKRSIYVGLVFASIYA